MPQPETVKTTTKEKVLSVLEGHPEGLSRRELHKYVGGNIGTLRQQVASLRDSGLITVTEEIRNYGPTNVHRLARPGEAPEGL